MPLKVFTVMAGFLLLFWGALVMHALDDRRTAIESAEQNASRTARLLDAYVNLLIGQADKALVRSKSLIEAYLAIHGRSSLHESTGRPIWLDPLIAESLAQVPDDSVIAIRDADGRLIASSTFSGPLTPGEAMVEGTLLDRLTSEFEPPPSIGRAVDLLGDGNLMLRIARQLTLPGGAFTGALVIGVSVRVLDQLFHAAEFGRQGAIELRAHDETPVYRYIASDRAGGQTSTGPMPSFSAATHIEVAHQDSGAPLRTVLILSREDILSEPRGDLRSMRLVGIGVSLATTLMAWLISRFLTLRYADDRQRVRAERQLLDAIDATSDVYIEIDAGMRIAEVSSRIERMTGLPPLSLIGLRIDTIGGEPANTEGARAFRRAILRRRPFRDLIAPIKLPGGHYFWIRGSGKPMFDEHGAFLGYRCMISDVTEQEARKAAEIHQDRLTSLGQLAGGIAHDFNNLLAAILGFATLLEDDLKADPPKQKLIGRVITSTNRAKELVQQILSFARVVPNAVENVDIGAAVNDVVPLLRSSLPASTHIEFANMVKGDLVHIDHARLTQVMVNLCTNANDALMDKDGIVRVSLSRMDHLDPAHRLLTTSRTTSPDRFSVMLDHDGAHYALVGRIDMSVPYAHLSVADSGIGIVRDNLARIFEPYFTTKPINKGSGLGLSVVHGIVLAAGGAISVTTRPGRGTVVSVFLPIVAGSATEMVESSDASPSTVGTVMVVDDQREVREMITMSLERCGMTVLECADGNEALATFAIDPSSWDAVVTDHGMPGMRGLDLIRRIKALRPDVPGILCSGYSEATTAESALAAGVDAVLQKPMRPEVIQQTVSRLIAAQRHGRLRSAR